MSTLIKVFCDGLCEPNPGGIATCGWIARMGENIIHQHASVICRGEDATNNVAEYGAAISAIGWLLANGYANNRIILSSDSQLLIRQLTGEYAVRSPRIIPLHTQAKNLAKGFREINFRWVPREQNAEADALSRDAYHEALGGKNREERAKLLVQSVSLVEASSNNHTYNVASQSNASKAYRVNLKNYTCTCPDFNRRGARVGHCKHILAVQKFISQKTEKGVFTGAGC